MLDIHQLNVFLVAAETLNFTQAAHRLRMTQPSVSQHIQSLERHFGNELFLRAGRNLELSDAGIALISLAREAVNLSIRIEEKMASIKGNVYGHLHVVCSTAPGKYLLPQILAGFHRQHPQVRVTCQVTSQKEAIRMLCGGEIHFALTSMPCDVCPEVDFYKFLCDTIVLIAPNTHPWTRTCEIEIEELKQAELILREPGSGTYEAVLGALASHGISMSDLNVLLTLGNSEAIALGVQEGIGVGFVSEIIADRLCGDRVSKIEVRGLNINRDIFLGRNFQRPHTVAQKTFWEYIHSPDNPVTNLLTLAID